MGYISKHFKVLGIHSLRKTRLQERNLNCPISQRSRDGSVFVTHMWLGAVVMEVSTEVHAFLHCHSL